MRTRYLLGLIAVLLLVLAIWLVPMALAAAGGSTAPDGPAAKSHPSGMHCPYLQTHPSLDPPGSGGSAGASGGTGQEVQYY